MTSTSAASASSSPTPPQESERKQSDSSVASPSLQTTPRKDDTPDTKGKHKDTDPKPQVEDKSASAAAPSPAASSSNTPAPVTSAALAVTASAGDWQAIWSPAHNAYYFYNSKTQETTWTNPLQPTPAAGASADPSDSGTSTSPGPAPAVSAMYDLQAAAAAQGIDPALAHLDPSLVAGPSNPAAFTYTAKFNARTGTFARPDSRDPSHLSEYERAKRMSEFYFDVNAWEREVEARELEEAHEEESKKRKRPTKKDLERFREQKRLKKIAKTAWLRT
ncbi:hypothetical protein DAEQUDRAFT_732599 [Daedalea quercina L-15889]|uniref:WW domain-containing protein n=1 Tax=Daedalea quercina L-15889 TaxID=1314783 RepID=A0A165LIB5_9APHY|nr:hypothetical protein DAEQUDRAFT_732599 [Daedalea quercina L-15889]